MEQSKRVHSKVLFVINMGVHLSNLERDLGEVRETYNDDSWLRIMHSLRESGMAVSGLYGHIPLPLNHCPDIDLHLFPF